MERITFKGDVHCSTQTKSQLDDRTVADLETKALVCFLEYVFFGEFVSISFSDIRIFVFKCFEIKFKRL